MLTVSHPDPATVALRGELDIVGADALREALATGDFGDRDVHLDLGGVEFLDSTGLAALIDLANELRARGARLYTTSPPGSEARVVIGLSGLAPQLGLDEPF